MALTGTSLPCDAISKNAYTLVRQKQPFDKEKFYQSLHYLSTIIPASVYI